MVKKSNGEGESVSYSEESERPGAVSYSDPRVQEFINTGVGLGIRPGSEEILEKRRQLFELDQAAEETSNVPATLDTVGALSSEQLATIQNVEDLNQFFDQYVESTELGHGFIQIEDKDFLLGVPFVIASFRFNPSNLNVSGEFVTCFVVTRDEKDGHRKFFFNDGSDKSGIRQQMRDHYNRYGRVIPMMCKGGLRKSDYTFDKPDGSKGRGTTYYIDES